MQQFIEKHRERITGVLSGFDRLVFRGSLRRLNYGGWDEKLGAGASGPESSELIRQEGFSENFWKPATVFHPGPVTPARAGPNSDLRRRKDWR